MWQGALRRGLRRRRAGGTSGTAVLGHRPEGRLLPLASLHSSSSNNCKALAKVHPAPPALHPLQRVEQCSSRHLMRTPRAVQHKRRHTHPASLRRLPRRVMPSRRLLLQQPQWLRVDLLWLVQGLRCPTRSYLPPPTPAQHLQGHPKPQHHCSPRSAPRGRSSNRSNPHLTPHQAQRLVTLLPQRLFQLSSMSPRPMVVTPVVPLLT